MMAMRGPLTGRHVLVGMLAFFGLIFAVNGVFVFFALDTWPGLSTRHAYQEGLTYNETLAEAQAQRALGWNSAVDVAEGTGGQSATVRVTGHAGAPVSGLTVAVELRRMVRDSDDHRLALAETDPGVYAARSDLAAGRWQAIVEAADAEGRTYLMVHDLMIRPGGAP